MSKPALAVVIGLAVLLVGGLVIYKKSTINPPTLVEEDVELPVNTISVEERPFITLTPDASGRNVTFLVSGAPNSGELEYEMVYNAADKQEGVFGRLDLEGELQPIKKELLLGSKSGGGKVTYHEGITGGSLTVTYGEIKLKEQFNFLRFDPTDPSVSSSDLKFAVTLPKTGLKKDNVVIVMKTFGLPAKLTGKLVAGPYAYLPPTSVKGSVEVSMKLPAGEFNNPTIYTFVDNAWKALKTTAKDNTLTSTTTAGNVFVVAADN